MRWILLSCITALGSIFSFAFAQVGVYADIEAGVNVAFIHHYVNFYNRDYYDGPALGEYLGIATQYQYTERWHFRLSSRYSKEAVRYHTFDSNSQSGRLRNSYLRFQKSVGYRPTSRLEGSLGLDIGFRVATKRKAGDSDWEDVENPSAKTWLGGAATVRYQAFHDLWLEAAYRYGIFRFDDLSGYYHGAVIDTIETFQGQVVTLGLAYRFQL